MTLRELILEHPEEDFNYLTFGDLKQGDIILYCPCQEIMKMIKDTKPSTPLE